MSKKATKPAKEVSSYETRDIVLGKVRGYPPWPGMVVDPDSVPPKVTRERPSKKSSWYCVRFFPTGDYAWLVAKDISKLQTHEIESYINEPYKKSGDLLKGYRIALNPAKWEEDIEAASNDAVEEELNAEIDELDSEDGDGDGKKPKSKKRKRESDAAPAAKSKPKATKAKKEPVEKKKPTASRTKKNGTKSKAMVESEDEGDQEAEAEDEDAGPSKKASPPPTKKAKHDKDDEGDDSKNQDPEAIKVRDWRHKLQKTFLSNKGLPRAEDMKEIDDLFTMVENYDKINIVYLSFSKIGKVMRHIAILSSEKVPRDDEFKFRDRAKALVDRWQQIINANKANGSESGAANGATGAAPPKSAGEEKIQDGGVAESTAALDLNGKAEAAPADASNPPVDSAADMSVLADVTMSEA